MITIDDYLRDMSPRQQVEALRSCLLSTERERDELREEVARREKERADWTPEVLAESTRCLHWSNGEILNLRQEIVRLRDALEKYGRHHPCCGVQSLEACTCGLSAILTKKAGEG